MFLTVVVCNFLFPNTEPMKFRAIQILALSTVSLNLLENLLGQCFGIQLKFGNAWDSEYPEHRRVQRHKTSWSFQRGVAVKGKKGEEGDGRRSEGYGRGGRGSEAITNKFWLYYTSAKPNSFGKKKIIMTSEDFQTSEVESKREKTDLPTQSWRRLSLGLGRKGTSPGGGGGQVPQSPSSAARVTGRRQRGHTWPPSANAPRCSPAGSARGPDNHPVTLFARKVH